MAEGPCTVAIRRLFDSAANTVRSIEPVLVTWAQTGCDGVSLPDLTLATYPPLVPPLGSIPTTTVDSSLVIDMTRIKSFYLPWHLKLVLYSTDPSESLDPNAETEIIAGNRLVQDTSSYINAGYLFGLLIKEDPWTSVLAQACKRQQIPFGASLNLSDQWKPLSAACDTLMQSLCTVPSYQEAEKITTCACFRQQRALDLRYGPAMKVGVMCLGCDVEIPPSAANACVQNLYAYKTQSMLDGACSIPVCQSIVSSNPVLQAAGVQCDLTVKTPDQMLSEMNVQAVEPVVNPVTKTINHTINTTIVSVPDSVWITMALCIVSLIVFIASLSFVRLRQSSTISLVSDGTKESS